MENIRTDVRACKFKEYTLLLGFVHGPETFSLIFLKYVKPGMV